MKYDIFISYCRIDTTVAQQIAYKLEGDGFNCFFDVDNLQGNNYTHTIQSVILEAKYVVYIYGKNSEENIWQRRELDLALDCGKEVFSLFLDSSNDGVINSILLKKSNCSISIDDVCKNIRKGILDVSSSCSQTKGNVSESLINKLLKKRAFLFGGIILFVTCILLLLICLGGAVGTMSPPCTSEKFPHPYQINQCTDSICASNTLNRDSVLTVFENCVSCNSSPQLEKSDHLIWGTNSVIWTLISVLLGVLLALILRSCRIKKNIKLCSDANVSVYIDGRPIAKINAGEVFATHLNRGEYLIDFHADNDAHHRIIQKIVDTNTHVIFSEFHNKEEIKFKCFIAGSLALSVERNALIAEVSKMHNRWEPEQFRISSYTFEDFNRDVVPGGQQKLYDTFIANEANWCVFIISNGIGEKTLNEYRVAMNSLQTNGHPKILFLASAEPINDGTLVAIKKEIMDANQYWNTCNNLEHMQLIFKSCIEWDVTLLSKSKK